MQRKNRIQITQDLKEQITDDQEWLAVVVVVVDSVQLSALWLNGICNNAAAAVNVSWTNWMDGA